MVETIIIAVLILACAAVWFLHRKKPSPDMPATQTIDRFIARFEGEGAAAKTQAEIDNAAGRLAYWRAVKAKL